MKRTKLDVYDYLPVLLDSPLFEGFPEEDLRHTLTCLQGEVHAYSRGEVIYSEGTKVTKIGLILEGSIDSIQEDYWGNRTLLGRVRAGRLFAESYIFAHADALPFSIVSVQRTVVLFLRYEKLVAPCEKVCDFHKRLISNLLSITAKKNIILLRKVNLVTRHTVREKVLGYLSAEARKSNSNRITLSLNRQDLADYLAMDRTTLSNELSKLQREGIISYARNVVELRKLEG